MYTNSSVAARPALLFGAILSLTLCSCSSERRGNDEGMGGVAGNADTRSGGGSGGKKAGTGGSVVGGSGGKGGSATGGSATGGTATGGSATGGNATGGTDAVPAKTAYTFEEDTENWETSSSSRSQEGVELTSSTARVVEGKRSLEIAIDLEASKPAGFDGTSDAAVPDAGAIDGGTSAPCMWPRCGIYVGVLHPDATIAPGSIITFRVFVPAGAPLQNIQPFVMTNDAAKQKWNWFGTWKEGADVARDQWVEIQVTYPQNDEVFWEIGVELAFSSAWKGSVFVDNVSW